MKANDRVHNGWRNFIVIATHGDFVWVRHVTPAFEGHGPLTFRADILAPGHLKKEANQNGR